VRTDRTVSAALGSQSQTRSRPLGRNDTDTARAPSASRSALTSQKPSARRRLEQVEKARSPSNRAYRVWKLEAATPEATCCATLRASSS